MIKDTDLISVRNRNAGSTGYTIPERNLYRSWGVGETKKIPFEELRTFSYMPGGIYALTNLFVVEDEEALKMLINEDVEPEYYYSEEQIKELLFNGTIDEFADFLDFAPDGAIEIAKGIAIKEQIPDNNKREMLSKRTGFNINNAIMVNKIMAEDDEKAGTEPEKKRRVAKEESKQEEPKTETKERRTAAKYNVVSKG